MIDTIENRILCMLSTDGECTIEHIRRGLHRDKAEIVTVDQARLNLRALGERYLIEVKRDDDKQIVYFLTAAGESFVESMMAGIDPPDPPRPFSKPVVAERIAAPESPMIEPVKRAPGRQVGVVTPKMRKVPDNTKSALYDINAPLSDWLHEHRAMMHAKPALPPYPEIKIREFHILQFPDEKAALVVGIDETGVYIADDRTQCRAPTLTRITLDPRHVGELCARLLDLVRP